MTVISKNAEEFLNSIRFTEELETVEELNNLYDLVESALNKKNITLIDKINNYINKLEANLYETRLEEGFIVGDTKLLYEINKKYMAL